MRNEPDPWADILAIAAARVWSFRREALLLAVIAAPFLLIPWQLALVLVIPLVILTRRWLLPWLHISRVRRQWADAVISAGAADPPPKRSRKAQAIRGPKVVRAKTTTTGDELIVKVGRGRGTVTSLTAHREQLAADLDSRFNHVTEVRIEPTDSASRARVLVIRRDPFRDRAPVAWPDTGAERVSMWNPIHLGVDEVGNPVTIRLVEKNLLIGGEPGAGKSVALNLVCASAALDPDCRMYLLDGKQVELAAWGPCAEALIGPDIQQANILLGHLRNVMEARYQELLAEGIRKVRPGLPLHVLICDELALYLQDPDMKQRKMFSEQLRDLIARGRAAGIIVVTATQKPSADVIPSSIRDLVALRLALRSTTPQASDTILGQGWAANDADASTIQIEQRGVGYLLAEGARPIRCKAYYLTDDDVTTIASRATASRAEDELQDMLTAATTPNPTAPTGRPGTAATATMPPPTTSPTTGKVPQHFSGLVDCLPLEGEGITGAEWAARAERGQWKYLRDDAAVLLEHGWVIRSGRGVRGSPFRYRREVVPEDAGFDSGRHSP